MTAPATTPGTGARAYAPPGGRAVNPFATSAVVPSGPRRGLRHGRRRPGVLDASQTALIPLRPLTLAEILDASFVVLRANARQMIFLPLLSVGAMVGLVAGTGVGVALFGELIGTLWVALIAVFGTLIAVPALFAGITWVSSALTRISLQTVLGPGFAPAPPRLDVRGLLKLLPPMLGLIMLQVVAAYVASAPAGFVTFLLALPLGALPAELVPWYSLALVLVFWLLLAWGLSYSALTVPIYTAESRTTPGWIGKPHKTANFASVYARSFRLIGWRNAGRAMLINAAALFFGVILYAVVLVGSVLFFYAYASSFGGTLEDLLGDGLVLTVIVSVISVPAFSAWLAYFASVQTLLYVDLRMRREGLDLAMRFDDVEVPQHAPAPWTAAPFVLPARPMPPGSSVNVRENRR